MVTYIEPQTVPRYMSVNYARWTLRMPHLTRAPHAQPSLSKYSQVGLKFRRADPLTQDDEIFPLPPKIKIPNSHIVRYTCHFEQYLSHRQNACHAHPSWAPTKQPTVSCWRYTPTPKQDRFQDLLEAICPDFLHTNLTK